RQMWGSTRRAYPHSRGQGSLSEDEIAAIRAGIQDRLDAMIAPDAA
ncbi:MAG: hypothetical protein JSR87_12895, partial [Proteobacteria bacterium]|nr:hypothetical protein [Pseudomonadota bacterium]